MIDARIKDQIFWIIIDGDATYEDFLVAVDPLEHGDEPYIGFISDGRKLEAGKFRGIDMIKMGKYHQNNHPEMPNAILMNDDGKLIIAQIYLKLTSAQNTRIFNEEAEAIQWVRQVVG